MNKYVVMTGRDDVVVLNADDNKSVKAYIAKGYHSKRIRDNKSY